MNKSLQRIAIIIAASIGFGANALADCPNTISPETSQCLSQASTEAFIKNYGTYLQQQETSNSGMGSVFHQSAPVSQPHENPFQSKPSPTPKRTQPDQSHHKQNPNIRWF